MVLDTSALPPVPNMKPTELRSISTGMVKLTAANGTLPTKLDTKNPSTTLYIDVKIIIATDGSTNLNSRL